jgi:hypothetical protein
LDIPSPSTTLQQKKKSPTPVTLIKNNSVALGLSPKIIKYLDSQIFGFSVLLVLTVLETHFAELLESGLQNRSFHQACTKLKTKWKKTIESSEMGSWREVERGVAGFKVQNTRS